LSISQKIYVVSGPIASGKSTTCKILRDKIKNSVLADGDEIKAAMTFKPEIEWSEQIRSTWQSIISTAKSAISDGYDVVIDYVVENELEMLKQEFQQFDLKYIVLLPSKSILKKRLRDRGDTEYATRQLKLIEVISSNPENDDYIIDNSALTAEETAQVILDE
jgi:guanylate kinase